MISTDDGEKKMEGTKKKVFSRIDFFSIDCTIHHGQLRDLIKTFDGDDENLYFPSDGKVSKLNYKTGEIVEDLIPEGFVRDEENAVGQIYTYFKTPNYFFWCYMDCEIVYIYHEKSKKTFKVEVDQGYEINGVDVTKDERFVFVGGQMRVLKVYSLDENEGMKLLPLSCQEQGSYANDVKLSGDNKYLASVTDSTEFHVYELCTDDEAVVDLENRSILKRVYGSREYEESKKFDGTGDMCDWSCDSKRVASAMENVVVIYNVEKREAELKINTPDCSIVKWSPVRPGIMVFASDMDSSGNSFLLDMNLLSKKYDDGVLVTNEYIVQKEEDSASDEVENVIFDRKDFVEIFDEYKEKKKKEEEEEEEEPIKKENVTFVELTERTKDQYGLMVEDRKEKGVLYEDITRGSLRWRIQCMEFSRDGKTVFSTYYFGRYVSDEEEENKIKLLSVGHLQQEFQKKVSVWEVLRQRDLEERISFLFSRRDEIFGEEDERLGGVKICVLEGAVVENIPRSFLIL